MKRTLITGELVVALTAEPTIADGAVIVEDATIVEVGPRAVLEPHGPFDERLGGDGFVVMPGFVNGHYHSECATGPGLIGTIFELSNLYLGTGCERLDEEAVELLATYGLVQCLKGGQTATVDAFYGKPAMALLGAEPVLRAYERVGMRTAFAVSLRDQNLYVHEDDARYLARVAPDLAEEIIASPLGYAWPVDEVMATVDKLAERWEGNQGRMHVMLAPDWTPACSDELLVRARAKANELGTGLTIHVLETRSELMWNLRTSGRPAVQRLADLGVLGPDVSLSHFVWATDADLDVFVDSGAVAVSNVGSNLRLSSGICRVRDILDRGGRLCFGTDGISFTDREDFFSELRLATYLQRQPDVFSEHRLDSLQVLRSAGENGARAIGEPGRVGALAPGMLADVLVLRSDRIFFPPGRYAAVDPLDVLIDRTYASDLDTVMVNGEVVVRGGHTTRVDEAALVERIRELAEAGRLYPTSPQSARWLELAEALVPSAVEMYDEWYALPIPEAAGVYNARRGI
jgi:5-methylthioadenosine/S-adenosylhomocysteine deaminase